MELRSRQAAQDEARRQQRIRNDQMRDDLQRAEVKHAQYVYKHRLAEEREVNGEIARQAAALIHYRDRDASGRSRTAMPLPVSIPVDSYARLSKGRYSRVRTAARTAGGPPSQSPERPRFAPLWRPP